MQQWKEQDFRIFEGFVVINSSQLHVIGTYPVLNMTVLPYSDVNVLCPASRDGDNSQWNTVAKQYCFNTRL